MKYNFGRIEKYWQNFWDKNKTFKAEINNKPKYYVTVSYTHLRAHET